MTRADLATHFAKMRFTRGAEIGVERGKFAEVLCRANRDLRLLAVDAWESRPGYREHVCPQLWSRIERDARTRLRPFGVTVVKGQSIDVARGIPTGLLDFVFIDADHAEAAVLADLKAWVPKVRTGGIVAGHDFNLPSVQRAVRDFHPGTLSVTDERSPSWWWLRA